MPAMRGVLVELPAVIDGIQPGRIPVDVDPRITGVAGDLFTDPVPAGDAYVLSTVLWLFDDQRAVLLQHNIKSAVPDSARVLVLDFVHPPGPWIPPSGWPACGLTRWSRLEMATPGWRVLRLRSQGVPRRS
jgi:hypothetical protein